jgi:hypothetical protein
MCSRDHCSISDGFQLPFRIAGGSSLPRVLGGWALGLAGAKLHRASPAKAAHVITCAQGRIRASTTLRFSLYPHRDFTSLTPRPPSVIPLSRPPFHPFAFTHSLVRISCFILLPSYLCLFPRRPSRGVDRCSHPPTTQSNPGRLFSHSPPLYVPDHNLRPRPSLTTCLSRI